MYINLKVLQHHNLDIDDYINLVLIRQQRHENVGSALEERLTPDIIQKYEDKDLVSYVRGKDGQSEIAKIRVSTTGRDVIDAVDTAEVSPEDLTIRDWLVKIYSNEDKIIGNKKRIAQGIAQFRASSGINKNSLAFLLKTFIQDEKNFEYNKKLENLFFDANSVFDRAFKLERCRLWEYYEKRQKFFDEKFKKWT